MGGRRAWLLVGSRSPNDAAVCETEPKFLARASFDRRGAKQHIIVGTRDESAGRKVFCCKLAGLVAWPAAKKKAIPVVISDRQRRIRLGALSEFLTDPYA